jgi:hypothetical protein
LFRKMSSNPLSESSEKTVKYCVMTDEGRNSRP